MNDKTIVSILIFPDFETLDAFGPVEVLGHIPEYELHYVSMTGGIVIDRQGMSILTEDIHTLDELGILLIPGGRGTRPLVKDTVYITELRNLVLKARYCLTVCTGSAVLAMTGLLEGKRATSNKRAMEWVNSVNSNVIWVNSARWVIDGNFYTSSGVSAGMDMALGFVADRFGYDRAHEIADSIEYLWNETSENDPFGV